MGVLDNGRRIKFATIGDLEIAAALESRAPDLNHTPCMPLPAASWRYNELNGKVLEKSFTGESRNRKVAVYKN
jgi:hypothetical protein